MSAIAQLKSASDTAHAEAFRLKQQVGDLERRLSNAETFARQCLERAACAEAEAKKLRGFLEKLRAALTHALHYWDQLKPADANRMKLALTETAEEEAKCHH